MNGRRPGGWIALAWRWPRDPRIMALSAEAKVLYVTGLCTSGEQETDGKVARDALSGGQRKLASRLVDVGLWIPTEDGWAVPFETWSRWQETAEQRRNARARNAERQARWRRNNATTNTLRNAPPGAGAGAGHSPNAPAPPVEDLLGIEEPRMWEDRGHLFVDLPRSEDR